MKDRREDSRGDSLDQVEAEGETRAALERELGRLRRDNAEKERLLLDQQSKLAALRIKTHETDRLLGELRAYVSLVHSTIGWKLLELVRPIRDRLCPVGSWRWAVYSAGRRALAAILSRRGGRDTSPAPVSEEQVAYQQWVMRHTLTAQDVSAMKRYLNLFTYRPRISIITPVHDPEEAFLRRAIESARAQVYPDWELCLVDDGSTKTHVKRVLAEHASRDARVRVAHLAENQGIVAASARALALATGEFVALLDHDDELSPDALLEVVQRLNEEPELDLLYSDEDKLEGDGRRVDPFFKPDWSPDLLLSMNYVGHLTVVRRSLLEDVGGFRPGFDGSQDYDLLLRMAERTTRIGHIAKVLYHWRKVEGSAAADLAAKPFAHDAARRALEDALVRRGTDGVVETLMPGRYIVRYRLRDTPLVSIIIPTRDRVELLRQCITSIEERTDYKNYEIVLIDNGSTDPLALEYLDAIRAKRLVISDPRPFNFARLNNRGVAEAKGDYFVFLNNDTQILHGDWLSGMLEHAQRPEVGAVGAKLLYPDSRIQHAGVVLGIGGVAGHALKYMVHGGPSYYDFADVVRDCSAVTAACMMVPRRVFEEVGGFDERLAVVFNDVELCCRIRQHGYLIVYTPVALLYHMESASRRLLHPPAEEALMWRLWGDTIRAGDPYYNPNLTSTHEDWSIAV